jgi:hypothetical protein
MPVKHLYDWPQIQNFAKRFKKHLATYLRLFAIVSAVAGALKLFSQLRSDKLECLTEATYPSLMFSDRL